MNSDWIKWILIHLCNHIRIQNLYPESIHLNSYTWLYMNLYVYEFIYIIHIIISYMSSCVYDSYNHYSYNDYMNSYVYEYVYEFIYMNSYKLWIHIIFSYMNSYVSWIHTWIQVYQGSRWLPSSVSLTISHCGHCSLHLLVWHWSGQCQSW